MMFFMTLDWIPVGSPQTTESTTKGTTEGSTTQGTTTQGTTSKPQPNDGVCRQEGFIGDDKDCKKFYRCVDNGKGGLTRYEFTCAEGTAWSQELTTCDYEANVNCGSKGTTTQAPPPCNTTTEGTTTTESTTSKTFFAIRNNIKYVCENQLQIKFRLTIKKSASFN